MILSTANVRKELKGARVTTAVHAALPADVIGWQEVETLAHARAIDALPGMTTYWATGHPEARANNFCAISWRSDRYKLVDAGHDVIGEGIAHVQPNRVLVWVLLDDKQTGLRGGFISVHTVSGLAKALQHFAQWAGRNRPEEAAHELAEIAATTRLLSKRADYVVGGGDLNHIHKLGASVLGATPHYAVGPTHGKNWFDVIWTNAPVTNIYRRTHTPSDHDVLVATIDPTGKKPVPGHKTPPKENPVTTTYGLDVSHYQGSLDPDRLNLRTKQGYAFIMAKATEGAGYRDPHYHAFRAQAQREGMYFAAYHFLTHGNIAAQVSNFCGFVTDPSIPVMLDIEAYGANMADATEFRRQMQRKGRRVTLAYIPHWYWQKIGSPSLKGWSIVSSAYPSSAHKIGSALYPGKGGSGWAAYGGVKPTFWQFSSHDKLDGWNGNVDVQAYEGNPATLSTWFKNYGSKPAAAPKPAPAKKAAPNSRGPNIDTAVSKIRAAEKPAAKHPKVLTRLKAALDELLRIKPTIRK